MSIRKKVKELKRELVLEEAAKLFEAEGYDAMKVSELAEKVGVSVGTIYTLFDSKEGLFFAHIIRMITQLQSELERRSEGVEDPVQRLRLIIELKFEHFMSMPKRPEQMIVNDPLFFYRIHSSDEAPCRPFFAYKEAAIEALKSPGCTTETALLGNMLDSMTNGVIVHWLERGYDLGEKVDEVLALFLKLLKEE